MFRIRTLRAQLNLSILLIFLFSFVGSVTINVNNSKLFFKSQLTLLSSNTAQKLSQQLQPLLENDEVQQVKSIIDNTFESVDLKSIIVFDSAQQIIYQRHKESLKKAPQWFVKLFSLQFSKHLEIIRSEWGADNTIEVTSDSDYATRQLWENTLEVAYFTLLVFFIALLSAYLLLEQIYAPLQAIATTAKTVRQHDYVAIKKLPRTIELRNVVLSMNLMINNIKNTFEELSLAAELTHKEAYIDPQTNIPNRRAFNDKVDTCLSSSSDYQGFIALIRLNGLSKINQLYGYQAGDELINKVIFEVKDTIINKEFFYIFRLSGSELSFFIDNASVEEVEPLCERLGNKFKKIEAKLHKETAQNVISLGMMEFNPNDEPSKILAILDELTLNAAEIDLGYRIQYIELKNDSVNQPLKHQKQILEDILLTPKSSILIKSQKVLPLRDSVTFDYEIFSSFVYDQKELTATEIFSMANRHHLTAAVDLAIIKNLLFSISDLVINGEILAISLTHFTFIEKNHILKIVALLEASKMSQHFVIQIHERSAVANLAHAQEMLKLFKKIGCKICINHFGSRIESLQYLIKIQPDFVKIDQRFIRNINKKLDNSHVVSAFVRMAHGLDIPVIAHCVETNEELMTLTDLRMDAALGYIIDIPRSNR